MLAFVAEFDRRPNRIGTAKSASLQESSKSSSISVICEVRNSLVPAGNVDVDS
jgi:hypothetical protein